MNIDECQAVGFYQNPFSSFARDHLWYFCFSVRYMFCWLFKWHVMWLYRRALVPINFAIVRWAPIDFDWKGVLYSIEFQRFWIVSTFVFFLATFLSCRYSVELFAVHSILSVFVDKKLELVCAAQNSSNIELYYSCALFPFIRNSRAIWVLSSSCQSFLYGQCVLRSIWMKWFVESPFLFALTNHGRLFNHTPVQQSQNVHRPIGMNAFMNISETLKW